MAQILLPELGEGITSVEISDVSVKVGDNLSIDDILIVVETDKASMEIPTTEAGEVSIVHISTGDSLSPGEPIVTLDRKTSSTETNEEIEELQEQEAKKHGYQIVKHVHQLFVKPIKKYHLCQFRFSFRRFEFYSRI